MKLFRYRLTPESPLGTPLQSDTIMGHLLCYAGEIKGINALEGIISRFLEGDPPFIVSSAFPVGYIPFPTVPPPGRDTFRGFVQKNPHLFGFEKAAKKALFHALRRLKKFRKFPYISLDAWKRQKNGFDFLSLFGEYAKESLEYRGKEKKVETPHNVIDRLTNRVSDTGGLFFTGETFFPRGFAYDIYAKVRPDFADTFEELLAYMEKSGFGRERSTGKGVFTIERDKSFTTAELENPRGNRLLNLSVFSGVDMGEWKGYYTLMTKYGRVWNGFGENNPFKKPFIAFREGSVFKKREVDYAACVLKDIHSNGAIIQCTLPLFIPFQWGMS